jgi:hypothetical protein
MADLTPEETELIKRLRDEANEVKDCATKYCFQALALSTVVLGAILPLLNKFPLAGFASVPLVIFLLATIRISFHKFETANRLFGYELHIYRRARLTDSDGNGWKSHMRHIGWEEAFYAWRVVQPFIYKEIYREPRWYSFPWNNHVKKNKPYGQKNLQFWFQPTRLVGEKNVAYEAGNYLYILHSLLHLFAICAWLILVYMCFQLALESPNTAQWWDKSLKPTLAWLGGIITFVTIVIIWIRVARLHARRRILQDELLSINSCAIVWLAVVVAHYRALEEMEADPPRYCLASYEGYTPKLAEQARKLRRNVQNIYAWMHISPDSPNTPPNPQ